MSAAPVVPALPLKGNCGQGQQCLLEENSCFETCGHAGDGQDGICLYNRGEGWEVARLLVLGQEGLFPSRRGHLGRGQSAEPWRCEGQHFLGVGCQGTFWWVRQGICGRRSWKCGWAGLFLVLSWGGRGPKGKMGTRVAQFPEIARWSTCPVAKD